MRQLSARRVHMHLHLAADRLAARHGQPGLGVVLLVAVRVGQSCPRVGAWLHVAERGNLEALHLAPSAAWAENNTDRGPSCTLRGRVSSRPTLAAAAASRLTCMPDRRRRLHLPRSLHLLSQPSISFPIRPLAGVLLRHTCRMRRWRGQSGAQPQCRTPGASAAVGKDRMLGRQR